MDVATFRRIFCTCAIAAFLAVPGAAQSSCSRDPSVGLWGGDLLQIPFLFFRAFVNGVPEENTSNLAPVLLDADRIFLNYFDMDLLEADSVCSSGTLGSGTPGAHFGSPYRIPHLLYGGRTSSIASAATAGVQYGYASEPIAVATLANGDPFEAVVGGATHSTGGDTLTISAQTSASSTTLATTGTYTVGPNASNVVAADFNGDGNVDLAVSNAPDAYTGTIQIFLGKGDGTFTEGTTVTGVTPSTLYMAMYAADFNGDGKLDIAITTGSTVSVLLGNGDGTFGSPVTYNLAGSIQGYPQTVVAADFNQDGHPDLAVGEFDGTVSILLGNGDGTFKTAVGYPGGGGQVTYLVWMDVNGDGKLDLIAANPDTSGFSFLFGNGDGSFQGPMEYVGGANDGYLAVAPAGNGYPLQILAIDEITNQLVLAGITSTGISASPQMYPVPKQPIGVAAADLNGDQLPDMIAADGNVSVLLRTSPSAGFASAVNYTLQSGSSAAAVAIGDMNGDGHPDVVTSGFVASGTQGSVDVSLNNGNGTLGTENSYAIGGYPGGYVADYRNSGLVLGDFNNDGKLDVAAGYSQQFPVGSNTGGISVLLGHGDGTLSPAVNYTLGNFGPLALVAGDFNGDGKLDLAAGVGLNDSPPGGLAVLFGNGDGTFQNATFTPVGSPQGTPVALATGDVNGDGKLDIVASVWDSNENDSIVVLLGNGNGRFQQLAPIASPAAGYAVALLDLNGDGKPDLVVSDCCGETESVYLVGNGDGTFQTPQYFSSGSSVTSFAVADWNNNGVAGLALAQAGTNGFGTVMGLESGLNPKLLGTGATPSVTSVTNAASYATEAYSPGEYITIFGINLGPSTAMFGQVANGQLSTSLGGVQVLVNGTPAPLGYVSATQINALIPYEAAGSGTASLVVSYGSAQSPAFMLPIAETAPGLFTSNGSGTGEAAVYNYNASTGAVTLNGSSAPATAGEYLMLFGTGEGQLSPPGVTGQIVSGAPATIAASVSVTIGGVSIPAANIQYAGEIGGNVEGAFQMNVLVPNGLPSGNDEIAVTIGGVSTQSGVTVAIQ